MADQCEDRYLRYVLKDRNQYLFVRWSLSASVGCESTCQVGHVRLCSTVLISACMWPINRHPHPHPLIAAAVRPAACSRIDQYHPADQWSYTVQTPPCRLWASHFIPSHAMSYLPVGRDLDTWPISARVFLLPWLFHPVSASRLQRRSGSIAVSGLGIPVHNWHLVGRVVDDGACVPT